MPSPTACLLKQRQVPPGNGQVYGSMLVCAAEPVALWCSNPGQDTSSGSSRVSDDSHVLVAVMVSVSVPLCTTIENGGPSCMQPSWLRTSKKGSGGVCSGGVAEAMGAGASAGAGAGSLVDGASEVVAYEGGGAGCGVRGGSTSAGALCRLEARQGSSTVRVKVGFDGQSFGRRLTGAEGGRRKWLVWYAQLGKGGGGGQ